MKTAVVWDPRWGVTVGSLFLWFCVSEFWLTGIFLPAAAADSSILFHTSATKRVLISFDLTERIKFTFDPPEGPLSVTQAPNWPLHHVLSPSAGSRFAATSHSPPQKGQAAQRPSHNSLGLLERHPEETWSLDRTFRGRTCQVKANRQELLLNLTTAHHHNGSSRGSWSYCLHVRQLPPPSLVGFHSFYLFLLLTNGRMRTYHLNSSSPWWPCDIQTRDQSNFYCQIVCWLNFLRQTCWFYIFDHLLWLSFTYSGVISIHSPCCCSGCPFFCVPLTWALNLTQT